MPFVAVRTDRRRKVEYERDVERYMKERIEAEGGLCWKFTSPGMQGVPDRWCTLYGIQFFAELKRESGRLSKVQKYQIQQLHRQGVPVYAIWNKKQVQKMLDDLLYMKYRGKI